jgi:hypothetical protein
MSVITERAYYTTGQVARRFGLLEWHVAQLFRRGMLAEPQRLGRNRLIPAGRLPEVEEALRVAGYLLTEPGAEPAPPPA